MPTERIVVLLARIEPWYQALALAVALVISAAFTYVTWHLADEAATREAQIRFEFRASQIGEAIRGRMVDYEQVLRGGVGLFAASESVERDEWRAYVQHLRIENLYPGIEALGYVPRVAAADRARHEQAMQQEGLPPYAIQPEGEREEYWPISYIEPLRGRNARALGFDMRAEPVRRAALERARDGGEPALSARVTLLQETGADPQAGVLMFVPVFHNALDLSTPERRRAALAGFVYGAFRMNDLMRGILGRLSDVRLEVLDATAGGAGEPLFDSAPDAAGGEAAFSTNLVLAVRGRDWTLRLSSLPVFERTIDRQTPGLVALASALLSLLVLGVIWSLATLRSRAVSLARSMTRELREGRERLALAIEGSNQALFDWNVASGRVVMSEQWGRIVGGGPKSATLTIGELEALVHPDDVAAVRQQAEDLVRGSSAFYQVEHRVRGVAGGWRWILSRAKVVERDSFGRALRVAGTNVDITARKEMERLKNEFIATVSHELRTPLTAIVGALGLLKEQAAGRLDADGAVFLDMAQKNSEQLSALINDILDIEKIESGRMAFRIEPVPLRPFLTEGISMNRMYAERHGVAFRLEEPVPEVAVLADRGRLLQVLTNLLSNAAKFSPHGQIVSIAASVRDGRARVAVTDCGAGVPAAFRDRIFEKFAQADGSDTRGKGGTGLGLSIAKAIVEKLDGTIGFESAPGRGATFHFELPLAR